MSASAVRASSSVGAVLGAAMLFACSPPAPGGGAAGDSGAGPQSDAGAPSGDSGSAPLPDGGGVTPRPDTGAPPPPDMDQDGLPDAEEAARGTNPASEDSDGDGVGDGVEVLAGTDPTDANSTIPPTDFYVVLPYEVPAQQRELDFTARLGKGDVFFLVDTTGSMGLPIRNVRDSLAGTIVPAVQEAIADLVMGVGDYRDFPVGDYGEGGDWSFRMRQAMTSDVSAVQAALNSLRAGGGNDVPESTVEALYESVAGSSSCSAGFGAACFRENSHPIIVLVTDAPMHNGPSGNNYNGSVTARSWSETTSALNARQVKVAGAAVEAFDIPFLPNEAVPDLEDLAEATGSRSSNGSLTVYEAPGGEVSNVVVDGIVDLVGAASQDVTSTQRDDTSDEVDATQFIRAITPLRASRATSSDATTFYGVAGGTTVTFQVTFENDFLPARHVVQIFRAEIDVVDLPDNNVLDTRNVYVVVPAENGTFF